MIRRLSIVSLVCVALGAPACGGGSAHKRHGRKHLKTPKLKPVKPEALAQFDAAMRALRLDNPESFETARPRLEKAVGIDSTLWEGWFNLGAIYFAQGENEQAIEAFTKALDVNPAYIPGYIARAEAYRRDGEKKKARSDYKVVIRERPGDGDAYARAASLLREAGDYEDALDVCREALKNSGGSSKIYIELGLIYLGQGRDDLAELVLGKAAKLDEKDPAIYNALALVALERGDDQLAFQRFDFATSLDPQYHDARFNTAAVLLDVGDFQGAYDQLKVVTDANPDDLRAQVAFAVAQRGLKKYDQARGIWERVAKRAPMRSSVRADALFNIVVLEMDFVMDEKKAKAALDKYLSSAPRRHSKRKAAEERKKELGL